MAPNVRITHTLLRACIMLLFLSLLSGHIQGQRIIVNSNGDRIIMFPDGSWRIAEPGDSVLIKSGEFQKTDTQANDTMEPGSSLSEIEREEFLTRQWNDLHFKIKAVEKKIQSEFRKATNAQFSAAEIYYNAEANKDMIEPERYERIKEEYEASIRNLKLAKKYQSSIKKILEQSKNIANLPASKLEKKLNSLATKFNGFMSQYDPSYVPSPEYNTIRKTARVKSKPEKNVELPEKEEKIKEGKIKEEKIKEEVVVRNELPKVSPVKMLLPVGQRKSDYRSAPVSCKFTIDSIDTSTEHKRRELQPEIIFTHTDPDLRPYFKEKELITCEGKLSQIDDFIYLHINFVIASAQSLGNFGSLDKGSLLRLQLLSGVQVSLYNIREDNGRIDAYSGHTIFTGQYALGKEEVKALKGAELDTIRILWSTGYEDYDVFNVDFPADQLNCLLNN